MLSKKRVRRRSQKSYRVLILVLMEYALEGGKVFSAISRFAVLILVLMEYALEELWQQLTLTLSLS